MNINLNSKRNVSSLLRVVTNVLELKNCPIVSFYKNPRLNDEPFLYQYSAKIYSSCDGLVKKDEFEWGGGISFSKEKAAIKAIAEGIERFCLGIYNKEDIVFNSANNLGTRAISQESIVSFSKIQIIGNPNLTITRNDKIGWVKGHSLMDDQIKLLPAQLVYVPYYSPREKVIRLPISTGAAAGNSKADAICRGICEIIERDSFMIYYLNQISPCVINLHNYGKRYGQLYEYFQRYKLELKIYEITTDLQIPVFMAVILDKTGIGPYISIGLKCSLNVKEGIIGAIEESQHTRSWMRREISNVSTIELKKISKNPFVIDHPRVRGLFWYRGTLKKTLNFILNSHRESILHKTYPVNRDFSNKNSLKKIVTILKRNNYPAYWVNITPTYIENLGLYVVKVIVPHLHPLHLDERYKYLGGKRLYEVPKILNYSENNTREINLNNIPHPLFK